MNTHRHFDLCIVGAGSAGFAAATTARGLGKSVALVDGSDPLGGLCILRGCMPSKTLLRSADVARTIRRAAQFGIGAAPPQPDVKAIVARKRRIIGGFADYRTKAIQGFPLFRGAARFVSPRELRIGDDAVTAAKFLIAAGSVTSVPDIPGLAAAGFVTSDEVLELETLPRSVIVLGGGPIACELSQYLARLGVETTVIQRSATLLSEEDADVSTAVRGALEREGIRIVTGTRLTGVEARGAGKRARYEHDGSARVADADEIFVALGRRANVDGLDLEAAGIDYDRKGVKVDRYLQTTNPDAFAAGDVIYDSAQLVHLAVLEGQTAVRNAFTEKREVIDYGIQAARAVFTDPQVGVAGLTERQCAERGIEYAASSYPFDDLGKAISIGETEGFAKLLASPDGTIIGVAIVGPEASDLIHEGIALVYLKANVHDVMMMPHLHPTLAEIMTYPAEDLCERLEDERHALVTP